MEIKQGKQEVWQHAKEAGMDKDIAMISKYFDISDVCIIYNGKMTFIENKPRKQHRVPALPSPQFYIGSASTMAKEIRAKKR